jgi:putative thioredoxin
MLNRSPRRLSNRKAQNSKEKCQLSNEYVIATSEKSFEIDVIQASHERPILVDFWAEWCGPCKSIAPILEELAQEFDGDLIVAKVDTDAEQNLAASYEIRSLPTMMLFRDGQPVEQIIGAQPRAEIRRIIEPHLPSGGGDKLTAAADALGHGDLDLAERTLREALSEDPTDYTVHPLLATILIQQGRLAEVEEMIDGLPINISTDAAFAPIQAQLHLANKFEGTTDRDALEELAADPENVEARFQLSLLQALAREFEPALDNLLDLIVRHREWQDGAIHKTILDIFNILDSGDPRLKQYRTRLARTLN